MCRGDFGRLGHGSCSDCFVPHPIKALSGKRVINVACGDTHTIAMTSDGSLYGFGRNQNGQLGLGHSNDAVQPVLIQTLQVHIPLPGHRGPCVHFKLFYIGLPGDSVFLCLVPLSA